MVIGWGFNATFIHISVILERSVLLVEESRVPGENHRPATSHRQTLSHFLLYRVDLATNKTNLIDIAEICL